jgi:hypothetical protein
VIPQPLPEWTADYRPAVAPGESYQDYLERAIEDLDAGLSSQLLRGAPLARYFGFGELVVPSYRAKREPPPELFPGLVLPLALAIMLRHTQVELGHGPLIVVATFRPEGGASRSTHKLNAAIDVKPPKLTRAACRALMVGAGWLYRTHAHLNVGIGTYGPSMDRTSLVHIDAGARKRRTSWRQIKGVSVTSAVPWLPPTAWEPG